MGSQIINNFIVQFRRGTRWVNATGNTLVDADGNPLKDDWTAYSQLDDHIKPRAGEFVVEFEQEYDVKNNKLGKIIPRFKIGDGEHEFAELGYISLDSFVTPTPATITVDPSKWESSKDEDNNLIENSYYQYVEVKNAAITANSKVDIQLSPEDILKFREKDITFTTINAGGTVRVCAIGQKPSNTYTFNVTVTEVL